MTNQNANISPQSAGLAKLGFSGVRGACKQILNVLAEQAHAAAERSRFAALPRRYLDDVGMTIAERDAQLV